MGQPSGPSKLASICEHIALHGCKQGQSFLPLKPPPGGGLYYGTTFVRNAGYLAATGTRYGAATPRDLYSLPRIYCYKGESAAVFAARLRETLAAAE